jgi:wyosine [tRNA(Phe)-imidazoG37] synthetase (radical SAM superfamily)
MMHSVYGPVPSRRLGQSLGVDPVPFKTCNYNCVYCQLGRTSPLTNRRADFFPVQDILAEAQAALSAHRPGQIDYVTIVGQGEPLLCASLGRLIRGLKALTGIPVAVITNGSLLFMPEMREEVGAADVVMPSLDAADEETFRRVNRPWPRLHIQDIIEGMAALREVLAGQLWVEVMLVKGLNDTEETLLPIAAALKRIRPDQVHVNVPIRPPAEAWVAPPDDEGRMRAMAILGDAAPLIMPADGVFELAEDMPTADAILQIIRRHPMRESELLATLADRSPDEVGDTLRSLEAGDQVQRIEYLGQRFWTHAGSRCARGTRTKAKSQLSKGASHV